MIRREHSICFDVRVPSYVRDCYFRVLTELLMFAYPSTLSPSLRPPHLVVLGNPGIGKSVLSFLFIRVLLELGTPVFFFDYSSLFKLFFLGDCVCEW
jgi:DNA replication protein DnaC